MPCYWKDTPNGRIFLTMNREEEASHCEFCSWVGEYLCDHTLPSGETCDALLCEMHAEVSENDRHFCPTHFKNKGPRSIKDD